MTVSFWPDQAVRNAVAKGGEWTKASVVEDLSTFRSVHKRTHPLPPITLLHTLLLFC